MIAMPQNRPKDAILEIISLSISDPYILWFGKQNVNFKNFNSSKSAMFAKYVDPVTESTY